MKFTSRKRGYTLLFAVLTATLVLGVAVFILSVSRKQYILSSTARDSTYAIYAATSGMECGAFLFYNGFSTSTSNTIYCSGDDQTISFSGPVAVPGLTNAYVSYPVVFGLTGGQCVRITFTNGTRSNGEIETIIESRGYNIGDDGTCPQQSPRTVERSIQLHVFQ